MPKPSGPSVESENDLVALFTSPPGELDSVDRWLEKRSVEPIRAVLLDWLEQDRVPAARFALVAYLLWRVGSHDHTARLGQIVVDARLSMPARATALSLLSEQAPEHATRILEEVSPLDYLDLATAPIDDVLQSAHHDARESLWIAEMLAETPVAVRVPLFDRLEARRVERALPAQRLYAAALGHAGLAGLHARILERIVDEDLEEAIDEIAKLAEATDTTAPLRACLGRALVRLRTAALEPHASRPAGWAYVSGCDGIGDYLLLLVERQPSTTRLRVYDFLLRASGDVREAEVLDVGAEALGEYIHEHVPDAFLPLCRIPREAAEHLINEVVAATRSAKRTLPPRINAVIDEFEQRAPSPSVAAKRYRPLLPVAHHHPDELQRLLESRLYAGWRLHAGDLAASGVPVPLRTRRRAFIDDAARKLATPALRRRLATMTTHMARLHAWRGETHSAQILVDAAATIVQPNQESDLLRRLLGRAFDEVSGRRPRERLEIGSPDVRAALRDGLFSELSQPRKADLLRLDVTEAACAAIDEVFELIPREQRPRDGELLAFASCVGELFADCLLGRVGADALVVPLGAELADLAAIDPKQSVELAALLVERLQQFADRVCAHCPVRCLERPRTPCRQIFFEDTHPAKGLLN